MTAAVDRQTFRYTETFLTEGCLEKVKVWLEADIALMLRLRGWIPKESKIEIVHQSETHTTVQLTVPVKPDPRRRVKDA